MSRLRIGIAKPSWGVHGGFEVVVTRITEHLEQAGHDVRVLTIPVAPAVRPALDGLISPELAAESPELVRYVVMNADFGRLDAHRADVIISTQPPSFAIPASRHLSIFFHHARLFYDLLEVATEAGMLTPFEADVGARAVRTIDQPQLERVTYFLAGSPTVHARLRAFNAIDSNVGLFSAGPAVDALDSLPRDEEDAVLCVSRHEFPKRTELFAHAMSYQRSTRGVSVGVGGRLGWVQDVVRRLGAPADPDAMTSRDLWCCPAPWLAPQPTPCLIDNVEFVGRVDDRALQALYARAICVVAPALDEDYGLTALEAMAFGKPVIVCSDGGGLVDLVTDRVNGLVVAPDGRAIAGAIEELIDDPGLRSELGRQGRLTAGQYSWARAMSQIDDGLGHLLAS